MIKWLLNYTRLTAYLGVYANIHFAIRGFFTVYNQPLPDDYLFWACIVSMHLVIARYIWVVNFGKPLAIRER